MWRRKSLGRGEKEPSAFPSICSMVRFAIVTEMEAPIAVRLEPRGGARSRLYVACTLTGDEAKENLAMFTKFGDNGGLLYPSEKLFSFVDALEITFSMWFSYNELHSDSLEELSPRSAFASAADVQAAARRRLAATSR
ncbi:hypothetical protein HPB52_001499 [Rhipicephalus sanguineus]|uniref:Uncharacterized protein n=1 Tax=Rhipicephalus sanguineus TaxID=34632 RepID=A0A9D4PL39_RHISA|nr:hypothetical protein HPB52_001499 [Rhipicephalus sanguineus]